jgi:uncharacterized protein (UPF0218 family)
MKRSFIMIALALLPLTLSAQTMSVRHLMRSCDTGRSVTRIFLPPVLIRFASCIVDDQETKNILKNVSSLYLVASEDRDFSRNSDFPSRVIARLKKQNYEEMLVANDGGEKIAILMKQKSHNRKEMVIAVDGDEDMVLYLKGKLDLSEMVSEHDLNLGGINIHTANQTNL